MKFFHTLRQDLNKTIINLGFIGAALMTCLLCFTAPAYMDNATTKSYSVFESIYTFDKKFVQSQTNFASINLFSIGLNGYISMFIPIIVAFPFMVSFCAERNNGLMRFTITRSGKLRYYLSKFFASLLSGGLAVLLGLMIYGIAVYIIFPPLSSYNIDPEMMMYTEPEGKRIWLTLSSGFIYGAFSTLPAFFLSSFCKNPYIITCFPFMLVYVWNTVIQKLQFKLWENPSGFDNDYYEKLTAFSPSSPMYIPSILSNELTTGGKYMLWFNSIYLVVILVGFILIMNLRTDKGN